MAAECVMAHHYVLRPYTQVIYDWSLILILIYSPRKLDIVDILEFV